MDYKKPNLARLFDLVWPMFTHRPTRPRYPWADEQEVIDWLDRLRTNALGIRNTTGEPCPNLELAENCEKAIDVIENLLRNLVSNT